jgi:hypothetical protein
MQAQHLRWRAAASAGVLALSLLLVSASSGRHPHLGSEGQLWGEG